jgi:hypothetical protein
VWEVWEVWGVWEVRSKEIWVGGWRLGDNDRIDRAEYVADRHRDTRSNAIDLNLTLVCHF